MLDSLCHNGSFEIGSIKSLVPLHGSLCGGNGYADFRRLIRRILGAPHLELAELRRIQLFAAKPILRPGPKRVLAEIECHPVIRPPCGVQTHGPPATVRGVDGGNDKLTLSEAPKNG